MMVNAQTIMNEEESVVAVPKRLLNRVIEKMVATSVAPNTASTPLSKTLGRHVNRPLDTKANSHAMRPVPATPKTRRFLFHSRTLVVHGKKKIGTRNAPIIKAHRTIIRYALVPSADCEPFVLATAKSAYTSGEVSSPTKDISITWMLKELPIRAFISG